jgi:hypothetical protein
MNTSRRGDITEIKVAAKLMEMGYSVSIPFGDSDKYDLVLDFDNQLLRAQVKTGTINSGTVQFNSSRRVYDKEKETKRGANSSEPYKEDIDLFIIYTEKIDSYHVCSLEDTAKSCTKIRIEEPSRNKNDPRIRWEEDYILNEENINKIIK